MMHHPAENGVPSRPPDQQPLRLPRVCEVCGQPATAEVTNYGDWKRSEWHLFCNTHAEMYRAAVKTR